METQKKYKKILIPLIAMLLAFITLVSPIVIRNYKLTGNLSISTEGTTLFLKGNTFSRDIFRLGPDVYALEFASQDSLRLLYARLGADTTKSLAGIVSREQVASSEMKQWVFKHPMLFFRKLVVQAVDFWFIGQNWKVSIALAAMNAPLLCLAIIGIIRAKQNRLFIAPFLIIILYFWGLHSAVLAIYRYSVPIMPLIFLFALLGIRRWRDA